MGNIVLLDDLTINKIAAGEVIERPASVVKEVVENSIDAGANNISIEIKNGGISYIRITDNGKGFEADDMEIAFERHATSKIRKAEDIENITSMGFRGEALASIAAIARVELVSKTAESEIGNKIIVEGGKIISKEEIGCPKGTTITIENLFYNTPVRYKFLKKDFTESGYIEDAITRIALVNPNIAIKFINSGKTIIQTSGNGNIKDIVYGIYGKDVAENIINVDYSFEDMKVTGVIGKPTIARSNRANQLFFVNKRYVKDKTLTSGAEQAFKGELPSGKYGFLILNIEMDPHKLDVNVHPAKLEVRFQEENKVFKLVYHAIKEALSQENIIGDKNTMIVENYKKNYLDEFDKNEGKTTENKGIGGFFRNIKSKNDFGTNDFNLVEELYNDKIKYGHNEGHKEIRNVAEEVNGLGVDYKFNSISSVNPVNSVNLESSVNSVSSVNSDSPVNSVNSVNSVNTMSSVNTMNPLDSINENYDNLIVKSDGGIELKNFDKKESLSNEALANFNWTDAKIEALKEQINVLTNYNNLDNKENTQEIDTASTINLIAQNFGSSITSNTTLNDLTQKNNANTDNNFSEKADEKIDEKLGEKLEGNIEEKLEEKVTEIKIDEIKPTNINESENNANATNVINSKEPEKDVKTSKEQDSSFEEMYEKMFGKPVVKFKEEDTKVEEEKGGYTINDADFKDVKNISLFNDKSMFSTPAYKFIGIVFNSNIIIEYENEMYIIDQRVANERILYEKIKTNYYNDAEKDSQLMLLPDVIELTHKQMGIAKDNINLFKKAGFDVEIFGENTIKLTGVPSICIDLDTRQLFLDTLDEINTVARTATQEIEEKFIETIASKTAEKAKIALTEPEVNGLMHNLLTLNNPFICADGKQSAIRMSKADIEKKFSRR